MFAWKLVEQAEEQKGSHLIVELEFKQKIKFSGQADSICIKSNQECSGAQSFTQKILEKRWYTYLNFFSFFIHKQLLQLSDIMSTLQTLESWRRREGVCNALHFVGETPVPSP